jgi:uncharacterized protein YuzE
MENKFPHAKKESEKSLSCTYVSFLDSTVETTKRVYHEPGKLEILVDLDKAGRLVGIEVLENELPSV